MKGRKEISMAGWVWGLAALAGITAEPCGAAEPKVIPTSQLATIRGVTHVDGVLVRGVATAAIDPKSRGAPGFALAAWSEWYGGYVVVAPTVQNCQKLKVCQLLEKLEAPSRQAQANAAAKQYQQSLQQSQSPSRAPG